ncbi:MAG: hypothetical protein Q9201_007380 [Fulgogasparrea decipioides]
MPYLLSVPSSEKFIFPFNRSPASAEAELHYADEKPPAATGQDPTREVLSSDGPLEVGVAAPEDLLTVSPYTDRAHLLDLTALNQAQVLFAKALTILAPVTASYATAPYISSFNWDAVFRWLADAVKANAFVWEEQFFYVVIFRSQVPPSTDRSHLGALDKKAHAEAMETNGLLKYWFGTPDEDGRNLATCIWRRRADAQAGSSGDGHKAAMRATINMYTEWKIERLKLVVGGNVERWEIVPWTG